MAERTSGMGSNGKPHIDALDPACALPGGEIRIIGSHLGPREMRRPRVSFGAYGWARGDQFFDSSSWPACPTAPPPAK